MDLSVILPSIRPGNIPHLYQSIEKSFTGSWELIVISPYDLPRNLENKENIKLIKDFGSPCRCQQIGLIATQGKYISWAADDGYYLPGALDIAVKSLEGTKDTVVIGKYNEGADNPAMDQIEYYYIYTHQASRTKFLPKDVLMLMVGIIPRDLIMKLGGFDCTFESLPMAFNDLSIRAYNYGANFIFQKEMVFRCNHMPGITGDHAPIHNAQTFHDLPIFKMIYNKEASKERIFIDIDNWKKTEEKWKRRFG